MTRSSTSLPNKTAEYFYKLSLICFYSGLPNFWIQDLNISKRTSVHIRLLSLIMTVIIYAFIFSEMIAFFTQKNLTMEQESQIMVYIISHPILWSYTISFTIQTDKMRKLIANILDFKKVYNDEVVEKQMIKKSKFYILTFVGLCVVSMVMYTFNAIMQVVNKEGTFTTIITAYPMVDDTSASANIQRIFWNVIWWQMMFRVVNIYAFVFSFTTCMSHQYLDLQSYFNSLNDIFNNNCLSQTEKELKFEEAYTIGIKLHSHTLECVNHSKSICGWVFSSQVVFNTILLLTLVSQLVNVEVTLTNAIAVGMTSSSVLLGTGLFMCNAGDVTVEASELCIAMYSSGWQNCQRQSSVRVRKLVTISSMFAQRPVLVKGFGIIQFSYQSYVSLVKFTYSLFSVLFQQSQ